MKYLYHLLVILSIVVVAFSLVGCTDAQWDSQWGSLGEQADVTCYSGGKIVFEDRSTGKVASLQGGGWAFRDTQGRIIKTFADCFVVYKK